MPFQHRGFLIQPAPESFLLGRAATDTIPISRMRHVCDASDIGATLGIYDKVLTQFDALLEESVVLERTRARSSYGIEVVSRELFRTWIAGSRTFLIDVFGAEHTYPKMFKTATPNDHEAFAAVEAGRGVLTAARTTVERGWLDTLTTMVSAEVFTNFLEMAEYLLKGGYIHPAASLTGAVLEDGLRRIATKHDVTFKNDHDLSALNNLLAQATVYTAATQSQIHAWSKVRNAADHGHFDDCKQPAVEAMHLGVKGFIAIYLLP